MDKAPTHIKIIWLLYLLNFAIPFAAVGGVILAYIWRAVDSAHPMANHFARQIQVFWIALIGVVIGTVLYIVVIGWVVVAAAVVYFAVCSILGLYQALRERPWG